MKDFARAKRRLRQRFDAAQVERLLRALLADVLGALSEATRIERVLVLTDNAEVAEAARAGGADVLMRIPDPGLNEVIDLAAAELIAEGFDSLLVTLGDLALLRGEDVDRIVAAGEHSPLVIVPALDGGTALLLRHPPLVVSARFGPESAAAHESAARERGLTPIVLWELAEELRLDLDTPEDAERLARCDSASQTVQALREILK